MGLFSNSGCKTTGKLKTKVIYKIIPSSLSNRNAKDVGERQCCCRQRGEGTSSSNP